MIDIKHGIAGVLAGIAVDAVFYPLETIKTRIMASSAKENLRSIAATKFKGFSCQMIVSFPYSFSFFYTYETIRGMTKKTHLDNALASVCAEIVGNLVRNPFEVIKQQMMVGRSDKILSSFSEIIKHKGVKGLYIGLKPTLARDILFSAIQLPIFEWIREELTKKGINPVFSATIGGMTAACIAGFISCPLDVIKTRLMTQEMQREGPKQIIQEIYKDFGLKGFFRGVGFRCGILTFGGSIYFSSLQYFRGMLHIS